METDERGVAFRGVPQKFEHTFEVRFTFETHVRDPQRLSELELWRELLKWAADRIADYGPSAYEDWESWESNRDLWFKHVPKGQ